MAALVIGASGQDGSYLTKQLLEEGQRVVAVGRSIERDDPPNWRRVGVPAGAERRQLDYGDLEAMAALLDEVRPDAVYLLAGLSSVRRSFEVPHAAVESHVGPALTVLEAVRLKSPDSHVVLASSTDVFGRLDTVGDELCPFRPSSPYAAGKAAACTIARSYRELYGLRCSNAFMSNHESALRSPDFLFGKLLAGLRDLAAGTTDAPIVTGSLEVERDWGYAPEYAAALRLVAAQDESHDLVLATGHDVLLREAVHDLFRAFEIDPDRFLDEQSDPATPSMVDRQSWNPAQAKAVLGWEAQTYFPALAEILADDVRRFPSPLDR